MSSEAPSTLLEAGVEARIAAPGHAVTDLDHLVTVTSVSSGPHADAECSGFVWTSRSGSLN
jgi:hypothetical protein